MDYFILQVFVDFTWLVVEKREDSGYWYFNNKNNTV